MIERPNYFRAVVTVEPLGAGGQGDALVKVVHIALSMWATLFNSLPGARLPRERRLGSSGCSALEKANAS